MFFAEKKKESAPFFWLPHGWSGALFDSTFKKNLVSIGLELKGFPEILCISEFWRPSKISVSTSDKQMLLHDFETSDTRFDTVHWPYRCAAQFPTMVRQLGLGSRMAIADDDRRGIDRSVWGIMLPVLGKDYTGNICCMGLPPEVSGETLKKISNYIHALREKNVAVVFCANAINLTRLPLAKVEDQPLGACEREIKDLEELLQEGLESSLVLRSASHIGAVLLHNQVQGDLTKIKLQKKEYAWGSEGYWFMKA